MGVLDIIVSSVALQLVIATSATELPEQYGPYDVTMRRYSNLTFLDSSDQAAVVVYPTDASPGETFPIMFYAHGAGGGGAITYPGHKALLDGIASFGMIVVATQSCAVGCRDTPGWTKYYQESLKLMDWTETMSDDVFSMADYSLGYGMMGHSMGGQATNNACSKGISEEGYSKINSCVLLHPCCKGDVGDGLMRPVAGLTGTLDGCCGADTTHDFIDPAPVTKTFANAVGKLHTEPNLLSTIWSVYSASYVKHHMGIVDTHTNYTDMIYGTGEHSLCGGSIEMDECYHL